MITGLAHAAVCVPDVDAYVASEQLDVRRATDAYLRTGKFSPADMLDFLDETISKATSGGKFARLAGETTWTIDEPPGSDLFFEYESMVNDFTPRYRQALLCLYDLELFGGGLLVDILRTHPKLLLGGMIIDNPNYLTPDEFLATRS